MDFNYNVLDNNEKIIYTLRSLYLKHGYARYKMSKFEEYDLYSKNKDFLVSDSVITFNDTTGKLMALKPDVTLSIIKNNRGFNDGVLKVCYDENVYRVSRGTGAFKEIMQTGLECIGDVDDYSIGEVLWLAAESLAAISTDFILDISDLDIIEAFIDNISSDRVIQKALMKCIGEKNTHGITTVCAENNIDETKAELLNKLVSSYGRIDEVLPQIKELASLIGADSSVSDLANILEIFKGYKYADRIHIDMSVISDMKYYNGVVFSGFINGVPDSVLSGGRYDKLMTRMHEESKAIGFAVYLDMLEGLYRDRCEYDADIMLIYDKNSDNSKLRETVSDFIGNGKTVFVTDKDSDIVSCRTKMMFDGEEVKTLE